jgi:hypothetical protein
MAGTLPETATADEKAEHTKLLARLKRLNTPADVAKAIREQDKLISSGELRRVLPKSATPEQLAEYRKSHGIPEAADKYEVDVPAGIELNDLDNQMLAGVKAKMHAANATPEQVKAGIAAYFETRATVAQQMEQANATAKTELIEELRAEWGSDYLTNTQGLSSMLNHLGADASAAIINARTADGIQLLNIPAVAKALAGHARELGFVGATVVPSGGDLEGTIKDSIQRIENSMFLTDGKRNPEYWKNPAAQKKYTDLVAQRDRRATK